MSSIRPSSKIQGEGLRDTLDDDAGEAAEEPDIMASWLVSGELKPRQ